jgi:hypothetical protein
MNLAEHHMKAIVGLCHTSATRIPRGSSHYHLFTLITGNRCTLVAIAATCSYRLQLLNTLFI